MKFDPSAAEERSFPILPEGEYEFEVENAEHTISKKGNMMWKLTLRVDPLDGPSVRVFEHIVENNTDGSIRKFSAFVKSIGMVGKIEDSEQMEDAIGEIGRAKVGIQEAEGPYPEKNVIKWFLPPKEEKKEEAAPKKSKKKPVIADDDLPF